MEKKKFTVQATSGAESLQSVFDLALENQGPERTAQLLINLLTGLRASQDGLPRGFNTPYVNTIPPEQQPPFPLTGRWSAPDQELHPLERHGDGGQGQLHQPTSAATSRPTPRRQRFTRLGSITFSAERTENFPGDMVYFQGHAAPGHLCACVSRRPFWTKNICRISAGTRRRRRVVSSISASVSDAGVLAVPTVSMGLGPLLSI